MEKKDIIDRIIEINSEKFEPRLNADGQPIHSTETITMKCKRRGHVHSYFIDEDMTSKRSRIECSTCNGDLIRAVRETHDTVELATGLPFCICKNLPLAKHTFINISTGKKLAIYANSQRIKLDVSSDIIHLYMSIYKNIILDQLTQHHIEKFSKEVQAHIWKYNADVKKIEELKRLDKKIPLTDYTLMGYSDKVGGPNNIGDVDLVNDERMYFN